jgi:hypothetical protein
VPPFSAEPSGPPSGAGRLLRALDRLPRGSSRAFLGRSLGGPLLAFVVLLAVPLFGLAAYAGVIHHDRSSRGASGPVARASNAVRLGGHATGLYPGGTRPLRVRLENPAPWPVSVQSVQVLADDASRRCGAENVSVGSYRGDLRIPARRRRFVLLRISMRRGAASACQGATFPLSYRARVSR